MRGPGCSLPRPRREGRRLRCARVVRPGGTRWRSGGSRRGRPWGGCGMRCPGCSVLSPSGWGRPLRYRRVVRPGNIRWLFAGWLFDCRWATRNICCQLCRRAPPIQRSREAEVEHPDRTEVSNRIGAARPCQGGWRCVSRPAREVGADRSALVYRICFRGRRRRPAARRELAGHHTSPRGREQQNRRLR